MQDSALVVANGILPDEKIVRSEIDRAHFVLAADGGADKLLAIGVVPDAVLGDFDSMTSNPPEAVQRISAPDQDATDLEKSVRYLNERGFSEITIIGVTGDRLDHTFGALGVVCKYDVRLVDNIGTARCIKGPGSITLDTEPGQTVSLMPCGSVSGLTTSGLKWPLSGGQFNFGERDGTSNVATGKTVEVEITSGMLIVYIHHLN
jgi:thiamine pyrophosphokinase